MEEAKDFKDGEETPDRVTPDTDSSSSVGSTETETGASTGITGTTQRIETGDTTVEVTEKKESVPLTSESAYNAYGNAERDKQAKEQEDGGDQSTASTAEDTGDGEVQENP